MYERKTPIPAGCALHLTKEILNGKWKTNLILGIYKNIKRPSDLLRVTNASSKRVVNIQLKELEAHGIICKKIFPELPPKVEYSLTALGETLLPIIESMNQWGNANRVFLEMVVKETNPTIVNSKVNLKEAADYPPAKKCTLS